jgi:hypothetical protein
MHAPNITIGARKERVMVNEATILERAKKLCEQDGFVWEWTFKPEPNGPQRRLSERQQEEYLARARAELAST